MRRRNRAQFFVAIFKTIGLQSKGQTALMPQPTKRSLDMTQKIVNEVIAAEINTLEAEGKALAEMWTTICKADKARFTKSVKADGFDTRLGKLMQKLKAEGGERISSDRLKDCNINGIDKRRRAEALWFVENETEARAFIKASKKGFTNLTALQAAMRKAAKAVEPKAETNEVEPKSNVGPTNEVEAKPEAKPTPEALVLALLTQCRENDIPVSEVLAILNQKVKPQNKKAVA